MSKNLQIITIVLLLFSKNAMATCVDEVNLMTGFAIFNENNIVVTDHSLQINNGYCVVLKNNIIVAISFDNNIDSTTKSASVIKKTKTKNKRLTFKPKKATNDLPNRVMISSGFNNSILVGFGSVFGLFITSNFNYGKKTIFIKKQFLNKIGIGLTTITTTKYKIPNLFFREKTIVTNFFNNSISIRPPPAI